MYVPNKDAAFREVLKRADNQMYFDKMSYHVLHDRLEPKGITVR